VVFKLLPRFSACHFGFTLQTASYKGNSVPSCLKTATEVVERSLWFAERVDENDSGQPSAAGRSPNAIAARVAALQAEAQKGPRASALAR